MKPISLIEQQLDKDLSMLSLGRRIKARRILCWMSQDEFAQQVGVSRRQVAYWESEKDAPSAERIPVICKVLHISTDWLLTGKGWLKDTYDATFYAERKERHLERTLRAGQIQLFNQLPFCRSKFEWTPAAPQDTDALALRLSDDSAAPTYMRGDWLFFRMLNLAVSECKAITARMRATVDGKHVAAVLNGQPLLSRLELKRSGNRRGTALCPLSTKGESRIQVRDSDRLLIEGVVYKYVRQV